MSKTYTLRGLSTTGAVKKVDAFRARLADIHIVDGFNRRNMDEEDMAHVAAMVRTLEKGQSLPPIEVYVDPDSGRMEVVEGHCRYVAYSNYQAVTPDFDGWVGVSKFEGTEAERKARILTSNRQKPLRPIEAAKVYADLLAMGESRQAIAELLDVSVSNVDQMLLLASADDQMASAIDSGVISQTEAVKLIRAHGDDASAELKRLKEIAKESGKEKVTGKVLKKAAGGEAQSESPKKAARKEAKPSVRLTQAMAVIKALVGFMDQGQRLACEMPKSSLIEVDSLLLADLIEIAAQYDADTAAADADQQMDMGI